MCWIEYRSQLVQVTNVDQVIVKPHGTSGIQWVNRQWEKEKNVDDIHIFQLSQDYIFQ